MTSDEKNKDFDAIDNDIDAVEIEDTISGAGVEDDEMDMDGGEDYSFDEPAAQKSSGGGAMKKMMAPVLVLTVAAAVGGYIVMNPDIISKLMGSTSVQQHADAARIVTPSTPEELPQPAGASADLPVPTEAASVSVPDVVAPDMPASDMAAQEIAVPDATAQDADMPRPPGEQLADVTASSVAVPTEDVAMNGGPDAWQAPDVAEAAAVVEESELEQGSSDADAAAMNAAAPAAAADAPVVETLPPVDAEPPAMPVPAPAQAEAPPVEVPPATEAAAPAGLTPQGTIAQVSPPGSAASSSGGNAYYDAGINLPRGPIAKETIREADPSLEPGQKMIIAKKDHNQGSQEALVESASRALKLQRYDAALEMYEQLYSKNKRDRRILMGLAVAQQNTGRVESAIQTYEQLLDIDPKNADAMLNMLGLLRSQYPEVALRRLMDLQKRFPSHAGIAAQIGVVQADLGHYDDAVRYIQMAASLEPRNPQHLFNIAVVADRKGAKGDAVKYYEQALEADAIYTGGKSLPREQIYDRLAKLRTN